MSELLDAIASRAEDARRNRESYSKESCSRRITQEDSAKDVPRLLAAVRAVEEAISDIETQARFHSDWENGRVVLADEIHHALTKALEGEK